MLVFEVTVLDKDDQPVDMVFDTNMIDVGPAGELIVFKRDSPNVIDSYFAPGRHLHGQMVEK